MWRLMEQRRAVEHKAASVFVGDAAGRITIDECEGIGAVPLHTDDRGGSVSQDAAHAGAGFQVLESHAVRLP